MLDDDDRRSSYLRSLLHRTGALAGIGGGETLAIYLARSTPDASRTR